MTYDELKIRIDNMGLEDIDRMSPSNMAILTDNFSEELVRYIILKAVRNNRHRKMIKVIMGKYGDWRKEIGDIFWGSPYFGSKRDFPKYMKDLDFDIECDMPIDNISQEKNTLMPTPTILPEIQNELIKNNEAQASRIKELESELKQAKEHVSSLEEKINEQEELLESMKKNLPSIEAQQKVRMELARKIMSEAGFTIEFLSVRGRKTKVATLMGIMLDIPIHTCQELNREEHHKTIKEINDTLEALDIELRI